MNSNRRTKLAFSLVLAMACSIAAIGDRAEALERGTTELGGPFVTGGVGQEEVDTINTEKSRYALAILTAAKGSGAFLADVHIRITDAQSRQALDTVMNGPWLLVDLPAGRYQVEAILDSRVQKSVVTLGTGGHHQEAFYFDAAGEVGTGDR